MTWLVCATILFFAGVTAAAESVTYYYTDQQGTLLATAGVAGNVLTKSAYRSYGTLASGTAEQGPGYAGHVEDTDSGLVYMQARYYSAVHKFRSSARLEWKYFAPTSEDVSGYANLLTESQLQGLKPVIHDHMAVP